VDIYLSISDSTAYLRGNWTLGDVTQRALDSISGSLQQIVPGTEPLYVDCRGVTSCDITGQQLQKVWLQCARLRGAKPVLVMPSNDVRRNVAPPGEDGQVARDLRAHFGS